MGDIDKQVELQRLKNEEQKLKNEELQSKERMISAVMSGMGLMPATPPTKKLKLNDDTRVEVTSDGRRGGRAGGRAGGRGRGRGPGRGPGRGRGEPSPAASSPGEKKEKRQLPKVTIKYFETQVKANQQVSLLAAVDHAIPPHSPTGACTLLPRSATSKSSK